MDEGRLDPGLTMAVRATVAVLVLVAVAGCFGGTPANVDETVRERPTVPWPELALAAGDDHDHKDRGQHNATTANMRVLGWDPLVIASRGETAGGHYCGDIAHTGERRIAAAHSFFSDVALVVTDVTDPAKPFLLGMLELPRTQVWDAVLTDDGRFAILATSPFDPVPDDGPAFPLWRLGGGPQRQTVSAQWTDACGRTSMGPEAELPFDSGVVLVDLADPTEPVVADFVPQPVLGAHSVHSSTVDGVRYVLAATTNLLYQGSYFSIFTADEVGGVGRLVPYGTLGVRTPGGSPTTTATNGHVDGAIQKHPVTGDPLLYAVHWNGGVSIDRLDGRGQVAPVALWNDYDPAKGSGMTGAWHTVLPLDELWDGRHITVIGQEIYSPIEGRPTGQVVLLDTTDPTAPRPVARWTLPIEVIWDETGAWSTHYVAMTDQVLWVAMNHGGVWAVDARAAMWPELPSLGVFLPDRDSPAPPTADSLTLSGVIDLHLTPFVGDVLALDNHTVVVFDTTSGVYTVRFDPSVQVPTAPPWTADRWIQ